MIVTCGGRPEQRASSAPDDRTTPCRRERLANSHDTPARLLRTRRP
ncbi:response regulator [Pseudomonas aeruginosa]|nr:response regulator [Pseudomonas aeruginosa]